MNTNKHESPGSNRMINPQPGFLFPFVKIRVYSWLKLLFRLRNVAGNLGFQFVERIKFPLIAQHIADFDFQFLAVKVAGKIQQMRLDAEFWGWVLQRRAMADI